MVRGWAYGFALIHAVCACSGTVSRDAPDPDDTPPQVEHPPPAGPVPDAAPPPDASPPDGGPTPDACDGHPITGSGTTWIESAPASGVQRPLRCLASTNDRVSGRFVERIHESNLPDNPGQSASESDRIYDYALDDVFANQPAGYYALTEMALDHVELGALVAYPSLEVFTGPYFLMNSHYAGTSMTLGRGGLPGSLLDVQIATHEYGHHAIMTLAPSLMLSTLHEGMADFFGCVFTDNGAFMSSVPPELQRPCANDHSWPADAYDAFQACQLLESAFVSAGWDQSYPSEFESIQKCLDTEPPYPLEGHQTGMIVSGALWSLTVELGKETFLPVLLRALSLIPGDSGDFGMLHDGLVAADQQLYGGAHVGAIQAELAKRGMLEDVGIEEQEYGQAFACLMTPEHRAAGLLPPGPLLPMARARKLVR